MIAMDIQSYVEAFQECFAPIRPLAVEVVVLSLAGCGVLNLVRFIA